MSDVCIGYTLYAGMGEDKNTFLIDMKGELIRSWRIGGMPVKLLPNGHLIGSKTDRGGKHPLIREPRPKDPKDFAPWHDNIGGIRLEW